MTSIKSKIYLIAIVDLIFNDNNQISFDDYTLEYVMNENKYNQLEIAVRLKNKINGNVDWGNLYYKPYDKASKNNIILSDYLAIPLEHFLWFHYRYGHGEKFTLAVYDFLITITNKLSF